MRGLGEAILLELVAGDSMTSRQIADATGCVDGRTVAPVIGRLHAAGLVERSGRFWYATKRGRAVDAILIRISADRGGRFAPSLQAGVSSTEAFALGAGRAPGRQQTPGICS